MRQLNYILTRTDTQGNITHTGDAKLHRHIATLRTQSASPDLSHHPINTHVAIIRDRSQVAITYQLLGSDDTVFSVLFDITGHNLHDIDTLKQLENMVIRLARTHGLHIPSFWEEAYGMIILQKINPWIEPGKYLGVFAVGAILGAVAYAWAKSRDPW